ncbi:hypothetical protein [Actinacidiphila acidipaludis]|uniref:Uncharacterized protein n=1 Tax=Actinacidiphila acidipaludis TaxID=2873382 RepID=A0ABS7Q0S9_9ACTN|nr:hypothetical protein [Streptomyces acidipaludis]MBY8876718.1 hypothetical protein [Streptomyces acidipaludis]
MTTSVPQPPKQDGQVDPDNFHVTDEPATAPDGLLTEAKAAVVNPDNFHVTDEPA